MRSELNGPPGGVWQPVCDGELAAEPAPAVIIEDKFIHELEARALEVGSCYWEGQLLPRTGQAELLTHPCRDGDRACAQEAAKGQKWKQKKIAILYGLAGLFAAGLWLYTWFVVRDRDNIIGFVVLVELTWVEIAQTMQLFAGVKLHPLLVRATRENVHALGMACQSHRRVLESDAGACMSIAVAALRPQVVLFQYLARVAIVVARQRYWFLGSCVIYLLFAAPVAFAIVDAR